MNAENDVRIVPLAPAHRPEWERLFRCYALFYQRPDPDAAHLERLWGWLQDPTHELEGLVAVIGEKPVGLAHFRRMPSPVRGEEIGFADDLFINPSHRGRGIGEAIAAELARIARTRGWPIIRWMTADDNYRARALYDQVAAKTSWNVYEMTL